MDGDAEAIRELTKEPCSDVFISKDNVLYETIMVR